jgi:ATP-dependent RNA helicase DDX24/MAK5
VYVHRSGRTARASAAGLSVALIDPSDAKSFRRLCFELQQPDGLPDYTLPPKVLPRAIEALRLARRVSSVTRAAGWVHTKKEKKEKDAHALGRAA